KRVIQFALPVRAQPTVKYELCVPTKRKHPQLAARFVREVLSKRGRAALKAAFAVIAALALAFLALPVVAIFLRVSPATLVRELGDPVARDALVVSLRTSALAQLLVVVLGTPTAYLLATRRFRGRSMALTLVELPLVLPPAVAGIGLLAAFGRSGLLSTSLAFTQSAVVLAVAFVAAP